MVMDRCSLLRLTWALDFSREFVKLYLTHIIECDLVKTS